MIATQQKELDKNKKELLRLDNLRYEMATLKKWSTASKVKSAINLPALLKPMHGDQLDTCYGSRQLGRLQNK